MPVHFTLETERQLQLHQSHYPQLRRFISQVLAQAPLPAYRKEEEAKRDYVFRLLDFNVCWLVVNQRTEVLSVSLR